MRVVTWDPVDS